MGRTQTSKNNRLNDYNRLGALLVSLVVVVFLIATASSRANASGDKHHDNHKGQHSDEKAKVAHPEGEHHEAEHSAEESHSSDHHSSSSWLGSLTHPYTHAVQSAQRKLEMLISAEKENHRLQLENANLRVQVESIQYACQERGAKNWTRELGIHLKDRTGALVGRTLASIRYRPPAHLLPSQMLTLANAYFKSNRNEEVEKSAVIMTYLTNQTKDESLLTERNLLMTAVSWYRIDNYAMADSYLDRLLALKNSESNLGYKAQARLWKALVKERVGRHKSSQAWLHRLLDHHPHSREAAWVNSKEERRVPAHE